MANTLLDGKRLHAVYLVFGTKWTYLLSPVLCNILLEVVPDAIGNKITYIQIWNKEIKWPLFAEDMIVHWAYPQRIYQNLLTLRSEFIEAAAYVIHIQNSI